MTRQLGLVAAALALAASPALGQRGKGTVAGVVKDSRGTPIEGAEVMVVGADRKTVTGEGGAFRLDSVPEGRYWVGVRRLGFEPLAFSMTLQKNKLREYSVELDPLPQGLDTVKVVARSGFSGRQARDFDRRRLAGWGSFLTRDDIERENPPELSWMVGPRLWLAPSSLQMSQMEWATMVGIMDVGSSSFGALSRSQSLSNRGCPPTVSINGGAASPGWAVNDFRPNDVEAVEIYRSGSIARVPVDFMNARGSACGVVVVWLRDSDA